MMSFSSTRPGAQRVLLWQVGKMVVEGHAAETRLPAISDQLVIKTHHPDIKTVDGTETAADGREAIQPAARSKKTLPLGSPFSFGLPPLPAR